MGAAADGEVREVELAFLRREAWLRVRVRVRVRIRFRIRVRED